MQRSLAQREHASPQVPTQGDPSWSHAELFKTLSGSRKHACMAKRGLQHLLREAGAGRKRHVQEHARLRIATGPVTPPDVPAMTRTRAPSFSTAGICSAW